MEFVMNIILSSVRMATPLIFLALAELCLLYTSPPRLNTPQRYAKQAHRLVKISGVERARVVPTFRRLPKAPIQRDSSATKGLAPSTAMMMHPMTKASRMETVSDTHLDVYKRQGSVCLPLSQNFRLYP